MKVTPILEQNYFQNETQFRPVFINDKGTIIFNKYDTEKYTVETTLDVIECGLKPVFINDAGVIVERNETETYAIETLNAVERGEYYKMLFNSADGKSSPSTANSNKIYSYVVYALDIVNQMLFVRE